MDSLIVISLFLCVIGISPLVRSQDCPADWEYFEERCFRYLPGIATTWDVAQTVCNSEGGHLASISSLAQNQHIYDMMLENNPLPEFSNYWTGMFKEGAGLPYQWVDGSGVAYTSWAPGEPSDSNGEHNCVQVLVDGEQLWDDTDCTLSNGVVCVTDPVDACPSDEWDEYGDSCYRYYPNGLQAWDISELVCTQQGAHLASLSSEEESLYIHSQMEANNPLPSLGHYWIGLYRQGSGNNFAWMDGSLYSYQRWAPSEPNDAGGDQDCVKVYAQGDVTEWDDTECDHLFGSVCERPIGTKGKDDNVKQYHSMNHPVEVVGQTSEDSMSTGISTGATAGIVLGGLVAFVCVGTIIFMIMYKHKKMSQQTPPVISVDIAGNHI